MGKRRRVASDPFSWATTSMRRSAPRGTRLGEQPLLSRALSEARRRFLGLPGVRGVGVGRRYHESCGEYGASLRETGSPCVKVLVERKLEHVPVSQRIPRWIEVPAKDRGRARRVAIDVVSLGAMIARSELQSGRSWPTAGVLQPGRLFAFGKGPAAQMSQPFALGEARAGTVGTLLRRADQLYAISAGHVFAPPCQGLHERPSDVRALGASGGSWVSFPSEHFFPLRLMGTHGLRDVMILRVPADSGLAASRGIWPDGFRGELAQRADVEAALDADRAEAFVWVERDGRDRPLMIPLDLAESFDACSLDIDCAGEQRWIDYMSCWRLRFLSATDDELGSTIGGDSGAPVFLRAVDGSGWRLLGFHFIERREGDQTTAFAADARDFFRSVLGGAPGEAFDFA